MHLLAVALVTTNGTHQSFFLNLSRHPNDTRHAQIVDKSACDRSANFITQGFRVFVENYGSGLL